MKLERVIAVRTSKTVYRDGETAVKVFDEDYSKADVLNEALNQARVEDSGLNVPKVLEVTKANGKWAIVTEFIQGKTLARLMDEEPGRFGELMGRFVDIQLNVHAKKVPLLNKLKDKMSAKIMSAQLDATTRYDLLTRLEAMPRRHKLCHGDFNPGNVIISDVTGEPYIIDWAHATQGSAGADAARTYLYFWLTGSIRAADAYMRLFCEKSGTPEQYIQKWLPIVAASQSVKGRQEEREFLLHWVNVVDYQ